MHTFTKLLLAGGLALLGSRAAQAQQLYDNFENTRLVNYPTVQSSLNQSTANTVTNAVNSSSTCATYVRSADQYPVIVVKPAGSPGKMADVSAYSAGTKRLTLKVRGLAAGTQVQLVLQNSTKSNTQPYPAGKYAGNFNATTTATNGGWELLTFTFQAGSGGDFDPTTTATDIDQMVILVAPGTTVATTSYLDDITGPELATGGTGYQLDQLYDNYEGIRAVRYKKTPTNGSLTRDTLAATLTPAAANNHVLRYTRSADQYDGLYLSPVGAPLADVTPFVNGTKRMTMRVWSPAANTRYQITLADSTIARGTYPAGRHSEYLATSTVANGWETIVFTFFQRPSTTMPNTGLNEIVLLINSNTTQKLKLYIDDWTGPRLQGYLAAKPAATDAALLDNPYPNPANGLARLPFSLKRSATVSLALYDNLGRRVAQVLDGKVYPAGDFTADISTARLAAGLYTCRLTVDGAVLSCPLSVE